MWRHILLTQYSASGDQRNAQMRKSDSLPQDRILKLFLEQPSDRKRFDAFFTLCYRLVRGYLAHLMKQGWSLPFDLTSDRDRLGDLTIDVLGPILASAPGRPCYRIVDHFKKKEIEDSSEADSEQLFGEFTSYLFQMVREELRTIRRDADPQVEHLKRRFSDALSKSEYESFSHRGSSTTYVRLARSAHRDRDELPLISYEDLLEIVEIAYLRSKTRSAWCRNVFKEIEARDDIRSCVKKHELLKAVIEVNLRYLRDEALLPGHCPCPESEFHRTIAHDIRRQTLTWVRKEVVMRFVSKKRIGEWAADRFVQAADLYLQDLIDSSDVDKLPDYFRETMPDEEHNRYLKLYKHPFETTMRCAEEEFRRRMKKRL